MFPLRKGFRAGIALTRDNSYRQRHALLLVMGKPQQVQAHAVDL